MEHVDGPGFQEENPVDTIDSDVGETEGGEEEQSPEEDGQGQASKQQPPDFRVPFPPKNDAQPAHPPQPTHPHPHPHPVPAAAPATTVAPLQTAQAAVTPENNLANSDVMVKYRTAADIANEVLRRVAEAVRPGQRVSELCAYGDNLILESTSRVFKKSGIEKGIAKPTSIAVNNCLSNFSALEDDLSVLHHGDLVKIELAVHIDGYVAAAAHTTMINPRPDQPVTGKAADTVCAAYFGLEIALRILKAGNRVSDVTATLSKVAQAFKCHTTIEPGHRSIAQVRRNLLEVREPRKRANASGAPASPGRSVAAAQPAPAQVAAAPAAATNAVQPASRAPVSGATTAGGLQSPDRTAATTDVKPATAAPAQTRKDEDHVFESGQVWIINVLMSSGDGKVKEKAEVKPTVYQRNSNKTFNLKLKVSRTVFNEITKKFGTFPFSVRALEDKRSRLGILECVQHNLLEPYPVYFDHSAPFVAQFKCTVLIPPNSTMPLRITSCPPLPYVHSEFSILNDRDMGSVLKTQIKTVANGTVVAVAAIPNSKPKGDGAQGEKEGKRGSKNAAGVVGTAGEAGPVATAAANGTQLAEGQ